MTVKIEKDVPIPNHLFTRIKPSLPFDDMGVGDSIYIENVTPKKFRAIRSRIHRYQEKHPQRMLSMTKVKGQDNAYRIFLIKDGDVVAPNNGDE